jgi:hypothetical protein
MRHIALAVLLALSLALPSCCVFKGTCKDTPGQIATAVLDCAKAGIEADLPKVLPIVLDILKGATLDTNAILAALGGVAGLMSDGITVVTCAIDAALAISNSAPASQPAALKLALHGPIVPTAAELQHMKTAAAAWMVHHKVSVGTPSKLVSTP